MPRTIRHGLMFLLALSLGLPAFSAALAQSGTKAPPTTAARIQGSGTTQGQSQVALGGYCPVCVIDMKKWVQGDPRFSVSQDGKTYLFPGEEQRRSFLNNPNKYTPALGGDCTVCLVEMGKTMPGSIRFATLHEGRLFLFPSAEQKQMFAKNPAKYADVDLAAEGKCTVCRIDMQQDVRGKPEFTVVHEGLRYWFPAAEQQQKFVNNPDKYEVQ
ncbi:hypothetical protein [Aureliella helgolandensis]|uniref:YHS domain protein n=1 Tax=Aureliella helgolandensis TaxID=2527968 RepID=A0A518FZY6_9BACT|nr:hypothetical protein [Aureliella helgolandensis]QDV21901.1 YHS domain protein [Aureliella helgolandensis]